MEEVKKNPEEFKSKYLKALVEQSKKSMNQNRDDKTIKDKTAISLLEICNKIDSLSQDEIKDICDDINKFNLNLGIDAKCVKFISENKDNENLKVLLQNVKQPLNIDVNSISELSSEDFATVRSVCNIDKVYVNSGWDEAAKLGYSADKYAKIRSNADKMLKKALEKLPENASEKEKFMAIYNAVLKAEHYDHQALNTRNRSGSFYTSRNLEGFFLNGRSVCAGTADVLKNLCECAGIEAEYVQGDAKSRKQTHSEYHAWVKVQIDGKWYNADPTWDANKAGLPYEYCLKSDAEFTGHTEDRSYNPTYERGKSAQRVKSQSRVQRESTHSADDIKQYYNEEVISRPQVVRDYEPTQEDYNYMGQNQIPAYSNVGVMEKPKSIFEKIFEFFAKLFGISSHEVRNSKSRQETIKEFAQKESKENSGLDIEKISPERANSYLKNYKKSKGEKVVEDKSDDLDK